MKKDILIQILLGITIALQLLLYHLPEELRYPLFLFLIISITLLWIQEKSIILPRTFAILAFIFILANLYSAFHSPSQFQSTIELTKLLGLFGVTIICTNLFKNPKANFNLNYILVFVAVFWALTGILEFTGRVKTEHYLPLFEPFHWPTAAASFFLLTLPLSLEALFKQRSRGVTKIVLFTCTFLITTAWILSQSYLLFLALIASYFVIRFRSVDNFKITVLMLLLISATVFNFLPSFGSFEIPKEVALFQDKVLFYNPTDIWQFATQSIKTHLVQGIGPGNFGAAYRLNLTKPWVWSDFASNEFLQTFVELGVFGFLAELGLFVYILYIAVKTIIQKPIALAVIFFLITTLSNFSMRIFPIQIVFFILVAYLLANQKTITIKKNFFYLFGLPILGISLILLYDNIALRNGQRNLAIGQYLQSTNALLAGTQRPIFLLNPKNYYWLAAVEIERHDQDKALNYINKTQIIDPLNPENSYQIAKIKYLQGNTQEAEKIIRELLNNHPYLPPKYRFLLADIKYKSQDRDGALEQLLLLTQQYPFNSQAKEKSKLILDANGYSFDLRQAYLYLYQLTNNKQYLAQFYKLYF